jgi:hypothetical protein
MTLRRLGADPAGRAIGIDITLGKDSQMKLLLVQYGRERGHDDPEQAAGLLQAAEQIAGVPGLVWKLWTYDDDRHVATSVYLFDSESSARAWGDGPMVPALSAHPGISNIDVSYFDVDEELSAVTRAPVQPTEALVRGR